VRKPLTLLFCVLLFAVASGQNAIRNIIVTVNDFSKGMMPILPPFQNDPEAIAYSKNMYSLQPGTRTVRSGTIELIDYDSAVGDDSLLASNGVDAMSLYIPTDDSSAIVFACGGKWFAQKTGRRSPSSKLLAWLPSFNVVQEIMPYTDGLAIAVDGDSVKSVSSKFVRDLDVGDTFWIEDTARVIKYIPSNNKVIVSPSFGELDTTTDYHVSRYYDPVIPQPYLVQSGNYLFTGSTKKKPQVIYTDNDHNIRIRSLGIVDSFYIDSIYSLYGKQMWIDTSAAPDDTTYSVFTSSPTVSIKGLVMDTASERRSWDTTAYGSYYLKEFQLISRRKAWGRDQWFEDVRRGPEAYYVRLGWENKDVFYQIAGNTDTSIYLMTWYLDTLIDTTASGAASWTDSLFFGKARELGDTIPTATAEGQWAYIYCAAGLSDAVVPDDSTDLAHIKSRGGFWYTVDANFPVDTTEFLKSMCFLHLTANDVAFDAYSDSSSRLIGTIIRYMREDYVFGSYIPAEGDTVVSERPVWRARRTTRITIGGRLVGPPGPWRYTESEAYADCNKNAQSSCTPADIEARVEVVIRTIKTNEITKEAQFFSGGYWPIRYASRSGDTTFFFCGAGDAFTQTAEDTTRNWEIVKVDLPNWSGVVEWGSPAQLVGFGDTLAPSLLSFSEPGNPWNWSVQSDLLVGDNPSDPIISGIGYDDQLVLFKSHSMTSYPGFLEVSKSDGLVGPNAVIGLNKFLYWLDNDGVKRMQRRDFQGYSVQKISAPMDPIFNAWNSVVYGTGVVPFSINPSYRYLSQLVYNQRDGHLYLFFPEAGKTTNTACLTYDLQADKWDGYFTLGASTAMWATIRDTSRIVMGGSDSAIITGLDYSYTDVGIGIDTDVKSHKFWLQDEQGWPVRSTLKRLRFLARGVTGTFDSLTIYVIGDNATSSSSITLSASLRDLDWVYGFPENNTSRYWQWQIKGYGKDGSAAVLVPYKLQIEFTPQKKGTNY